MEKPEAALVKYFADRPQNIYQKGEIIMGGHRTAPYLFFINSGFVKGYTIDDDGNCHILILKGPSDILPVNNLFTTDESTIFYEAITDLSIHKVARAAYEADLKSDPDLAMATLKKIIGVMRDNTKRLQNLTISDARQRIIFRLLFLARRFGAESANYREVIFVPVTYPDLAESINLTRETVNRIVSQLDKEALVSKTRGHLTIIDKRGLEAEVAAFHSSMTA